MDWLSSFFREGFAAATPLGLAAFAMLIIVALVIVVVAIRNGSPILFGTFAMVCVVGILVFDQLSHRLIPIPPGEGAAAPAPANSPRWFDTGLQADWGGRDSFYGAGEFPLYAAEGKKLCNADLVGRIATCWQSRPADSKSMASSVPTNFRQNRNDWCAYKDSSVALSRAPDGQFPGRVYVCAHSIEPNLKEQ